MLRGHSKYLHSKTSRKNAKPRDNVEMRGNAMSLLPNALEKSAEQRWAQLPGSSEAFRPQVTLKR
jgi:hypothetical protein